MPSVLLSTPKDAAEVTVGGGEEHESCGSKESWFLGPHASGGLCTTSEDTGGGACGAAGGAGGGACGAASTLKASNEEIMRGAERGYMMRK